MYLPTHDRSSYLIIQRPHPLIFSFKILDHNLHFCATRRPGKSQPASCNKLRTFNEPSTHKAGLILPNAARPPEVFWARSAAFSYQFYSAKTIGRACSGCRLVRGLRSLVFRPVTIVAILLRKTLLELSIQHRTNLLFYGLKSNQASTSMLFNYRPRLHKDQMFVAGWQATSVTVQAMSQSRHQTLGPVRHELPTSD